MDTLRQQVERIFPMPENFSWDDIERLTDREEVVDGLMELAEAAYDHKEQELGHEQMRFLERIWMLNVIDKLWIQHLTAIDDLREGIGLRAYGQRDPLIEYKVEAARMFDELQAAIRSNVVNAIYHLQPPQQQAPPPPPTEAAFTGQSRSATPAAGGTNGAAPRSAASPGASGASGARPPRATGVTAQAARVAPAKVGRNDPCPCGSGKKYKKCHGASA
jgi:preprotein translocase subunit SecA